MQALRRTSVVAALLACAAGILLLRQVLLRAPIILVDLEDRFAASLGPLAARLQFPNVVDGLLVAFLGAGFLALALAWKRNGLPSPARDVRLDGPAHPFLSRGVPSLACLTVLAAAELWTGAVMFRDEIPPAWLWLTGLAGFVALAVLADRKAAAAPDSSPPVRAAEVAGVALVAAGSAAVAGYRLHGWEWAGSPDSYGFYGVARDLFEGRLQRPFLSPDGVFGMYAIASSWLQAILFPFSGPTGAALRAGNLVLVAALAALGHVFARPLLGRTGAFATSVLLGSSVLVQTYAKNGYNNLQGLFFAMLTLTLASRAAATRRWTPLVLSGLAAGAGLLSYALAAISGAAVLLWIALSARPSKRSFRAVVVFGLASLAAAAPCILSRYYVEVHLDKVSPFSPELKEAGPTRPPLEGRVAQALVQPFYNLEPGHAAAGPRVDPVSALLLLAGAAALVAGVGARAASRALLAVCAFWPFAIGLLQPYYSPTSPWVLLATPAWAILGGSGVAALASAIPLARVAGAVALAALPAAAGWSTWQVHESSFASAPIPPLSFTVGVAQAAGASGVPTAFLVPMLSAGEGSPVLEAVKAFAPSVKAESTTFDDPSLPARLEALRDEPAILVLYAGGEIPARDGLYAIARAAWPGAREVRYRSLPSAAGEPSVQVFVNARARAAVPFLPARNRLEE